LRFFAININKYSDYKDRKKQEYMESIKNFQFTDSPINKVIQTLAIHSKPYIFKVYTFLISLQQNFS